MGDKRTYNLAKLLHREFLATRTTPVLPPTIIRFTDQKAGS
jgi:hypothetical protein